MTPEYPKRLARIASVLFLVGSLIWVQLPIEFSNFNIASVIIFIASAVSWISLEFSDYFGATNRHDNVISEDVDKLNSLLKFVDSRQYYILRHHAIETYFSDNDYRGLSDIIHYYENDIFPFHSEKIQVAYEEFHLKSVEFIHRLWNLYTSDGKGRATWRPRGEEYVSDDFYRRVQAEIADLNRKATGLADLWMNLIQVARSELKGASRKIEQYELR